MNPTTAKYLAKSYRSDDLAAAAHSRRVAEVKAAHTADASTSAAIGTWRLVARFAGLLGA